MQNKSLLLANTPKQLSKVYLDHFFIWGLGKGGGGEGRANSSSVVKSAELVIFTFLFAAQHM